MSSLALHRGWLGRIVTVLCPGGLVGGVFALLSFNPSVPAWLRIVCGVLAALSLIYGLAMSVRISIEVTNDGVAISNGLHSYRLAWPEINRIEVLPIRQLDGAFFARWLSRGAGINGLVFFVGDRSVSARATMMMNNRDKQRLLDTLRAVADRDAMISALPSRAQLSWVGPRGRTRT